jgi:signal transduction histidine kinase
MTENTSWQKWAQPLDTMTVLLVDDEENVLNALRRVLRHEPYKICTQSSALKALELLKEQKFQLIISDQRMPEISGIEFLEKARQLSPESIRVMLTGYSDLKTAEEAINRVEIYRFLSKPWNDQDLKATIIQGLTKWQLQNANQVMFKLIEEQNQKLQQFNRELEKKVEERTAQLKEAEARLVQSEKMATVGLLAGGIAHEINNPLGGILALAQLLQMDLKDNPAVLQDLKTIEDAVLHCKRIINNLLGFSRNPDAKHREPVSIPSIVQNSLSLVGYTFKNANINVVEQYDPELPLLMANPNQIQQVMINLLTNAQQAMKREGTVFIRGLHNGNGKIIVEVEDQGEGIPEAIRSKIFDPFFTTKEQGKGTGLGLFITYGIVRDHNGRIEVQSEPGKGTCMRLVFDGQAINPVQQKG